MALEFLWLKFLGVRLWIWLYLLFSLIAGVTVAVYWHREKIKKFYYQWRFPEKLLKCVVHYSGGLYREYWRVIPDDDFFVFEGKQYLYSEKSVIKENDFFAKRSTKDMNFEVILDGKKYNLAEYYNIKRRGSKFPEIHFFYNCPNPIKFKIDQKELELSSKQLEEFKANDLFGKLLTLETEKQLIMIVIIMVVLNGIMTFVLLAKNMGWLK